MKEFTNLDRVLVPELFAELCEKHTVFSVPKNSGISAFDDAYITAIEYIGEMWRTEYDDEDIEFLVDNLHIDPTNGTVFILEHTCNPEEEPVLFFESLYNPYWKPITKWACVLETNLSLLDVDRVISYSVDGWYNVDNVDTKSLVVTLHKQLIVETLDIEQYVTAVNHIGGDIRVSDYFPVNW